MSGTSVKMYGRTIKWRNSLPVMVSVRKNLIIPPFLSEPLSWRGCVNCVPLDTVESIMKQPIGEEVGIICSICGHEINQHLGSKSPLHNCVRMCHPLHWRCMIHGAKLRHSQKQCNHETWKIWELFETQLISRESAQPIGTIPKESMRPHDLQCNEQLCYLWLWWLGSLHLDEKIYNFKNK